MVQKRESLRQGTQGAVTLVYMWGVPDLGWWQMGEITKRDSIDLSAGYPEKSGEKGEEVKDDSEVLSPGH